MSTDFEKELRLLEDSLVEPNTCEDYIEVVELSCEDMKEELKSKVKKDYTNMTGRNLKFEEDGKGEEDRSKLLKEFKR